MSERYTTRDVDAALGRAMSSLPALYRRVSRPILVTFVATDTPTDVQHGLGAVPDGMVPIWWDCLFLAVPGQVWTHELAYLQSPTAPASALVVFVQLAETTP